MKIPTPRVKRRAPPGCEEDPDEDATPRGHCVKNWTGSGIGCLRELPIWSGKEVDDMMEAWNYEGPGKGYSLSRQPFGNVHFAGTEIAEEWRGFMEGAARSGLKGAKEIIEALKESAVREG